MEKIESIDEAVIEQLNKDIEMLVRYKEIHGIGFSRSDQILYRRAKESVPQLIDDILNSLGVQNTEGLVKVSNIDIRIDTLTELLRQEGIVFDVKDDTIIAKYSGEATGDFVIVFELQAVNGWISFRSYASGKVIKCEKQNEVLKLLNGYNLSTRHSKACLQEDNTIVLLRNDNANTIWDKEGLRQLILIDIMVMIDFYKTNHELLVELFQ